MPGQCSFEYSEGSCRALMLLSTQMALGHVTTRRALRGQLSTWAFRHSSTQGTRALGHSGTRALGHCGYIIQQTPQFGAPFLGVIEIIPSQIFSLFHHNANQPSRYKYPRSACSFLLVAGLFPNDRGFPIYPEQAAKPNSLLMSEQLLSCSSIKTPRIFHWEMPYCQPFANVTDFDPKVFVRVAFFVRAFQNLIRRWLPIFSKTMESASC